LGKKELTNMGEGLVKKGNKGGATSVSGYCKHPGNLENLPRPAKTVKKKKGAQKKKAEVFQWGASLREKGGAHSRIVGQP